MTLDDLVNAREIVALEQTYGPFPQQHHRLAVGTVHLDFWREQVLRERRGEVVLVIQRTSLEVLLHTKMFYPPGVYRLPSGGVSWGEAVADALRREVYEETGFIPRDERLLGLLSYEFQGDGCTVPFVSYTFLLSGVEGSPAAQDANERIASFCWSPVAELLTVAATLRSLPEDAPGRRDWGRFRALVHDFVAQRMGRSFSCVEEPFTPCTF
jgi:ADP-ribose pyrophosphatase YjhB (NUDIX family)